MVVQSAGHGLIGRLESFASPALEFVGQAAFAFLLTVFMLLKREDLRNRMIRLTGHGKVTTKTKAVDDAGRRIGTFLLTQLILNSAFAAAILVANLLLGVKAPRCGRRSRSWCGTCRTRAPGSASSRRRCTSWR